MRKRRNGDGKPRQQDVDFFHFAWLGKQDSKNRCRRLWASVSFCKTGIRIDETGRHRAILCEMMLFRLLQLKMAVIAGIVFLLITINCRGQTGVLVIERVEGVPTLGDSVSRGSSGCLDTMVTSFVVSFIFDGVFREFRSMGNCFALPNGVRSGTVVYCSQIISEPKPDVQVRLPSQNFFVR